MAREFREYYGMDPQFPRDQYILRCEKEAKNRSIYFCSKSVKQILESADFERLHVVNTGVRLFVRQVANDNAGFRLTADGLPLLEKVIMDDRRKVEISDEDLKTLLTELMPKVDTLTEATQEKLKKLGRAILCVYVCYEAADHGRFA